MGREELAERFLTAWNNKDVSGLLKLMHPQGSYYDAFWGEICSGSDLSKYFGTNFAIDTRWYRPDDDIVATANGMIIRYVAFDRDDPEGLEPILNGAEVITLSDGLIMTVSDFYCDPDTVQLVEIAKLAENQHGRLNTAPLGLSAKSSAHIKRRLAELAGANTIFLDPALTVTKLADVVGCSVMHLFHILENEKQTTFLQFVDECRARYATTLLTDVPNDAIRIDQVVEQAGFESVEALNRAFQATFGVSGLEYAQQFSQ